MRSSRIGSLLFLILMSACSWSRSAVLDDNLTSVPDLVASPSMIPNSTASAPIITTIAPATATAVPPIEFDYYILRFEYSTSSDWTRLRIENFPGARAFASRNVEGNPHEAAVYADSQGSYRVELNRPPAKLTDEPTASMIIDFVVAANQINMPLLLTQEKGAWNASTLKVLLIQDEEQILLQEVRQRREHHQFELDLSPLETHAPGRAVIQQEPGTKMLWAVYYPWYRGEVNGWGGWQDPMYTDRPLDHYSSAGRTSVENQIRLAQSAGLDGFLVSYSGMGEPGEPDAECFKHLLNFAAQTGFHIAAYVEAADYSALASGGDAQAAKVEMLIKWIADAVRVYGTQPGYMQLDGKPLIFLHGANLAPSGIWSQMLSELESQGISASYWGEGYQNPGFFDGAYAYGVPEDGDFSRAYAAMEDYQNYHFLLQEQPKTFRWAASVMPGFDNTPLLRWFGSWPSSRIERHGGDFYRATFEQALNSGADWIIITSWNEFQENSQIEPSEFYDHLYLEITAEFAAKWKSP